MTTPPWKIGCRIQPDEARRDTALTSRRKLPVRTSKTDERDTLPWSPPDRPVRLRQVETKHRQLPAHAADDADAFAEIDLRVAGRMGERDEFGAGDPHVSLHHRVAAGVAMFDPQPFENPLIGLDRVDETESAVRASAVPAAWTAHSWVRGIAAHLGNRVPAQPKDPRRLAPALSFDEYKPSSRCVRLHCKYPRPPLRIKVRKDFSPKVAGFYSATQPHYAAAPWPNIAPPRTARNGSLTAERSRRRP